MELKELLYFRFWKW